MRFREVIGKHALVHKAVVEHNVLVVPREAGDVVLQPRVHVPGRERQVDLGHEEALAFGKRRERSGRQGVIG